MVMIEEVLNQTENRTNEILINEENYCDALTLSTIEDLIEKSKNINCRYNLAIGHKILNKVADATFFRSEVCGEPICCICTKQNKEILQFITTKCKHKFHYTCAVRFWSFCLHCPSCGIKLVTNIDRK